MKVCLLLDNILVDVTDDADETPLPDATYEEGTVCPKEIEYTSLLIIALLGVADDGVVCLLFSSTLAYVINAVEVCSAVMLTIVAEVRLPVDVLLIFVTDFTKSLLDDVPLSVTEDKVVVSSLLATATAEVTVCAEFSSLLDIALVEILILSVIDSCSTDDEYANLLLDDELVEVTDGAVIRLLDNELVSSLLDITLVDMTDDEDANILLDGGLVNFIEIASLFGIVLAELVDAETDIDKAEICLLAAGIVEFSSLFVAVLVEVSICAGVSSMFDAAVVEVTDAIHNIVVLFDTTPVTDTDVIGVVLALDITLVDTRDNEGVKLMLDTALVDVTDGVAVEVLVSLLDIRLADTTDDTDVSSLTDSVLGDFIDDKEVPSLLEMILTEVVDDVLLEIEPVNINDDAEACPVAVLGVVEFSLLFITVLVGVTVCTDVSSVFDAAVVEVTDAVDIDTVLVAVISCSLLDMKFVLLTDDVEINAPSDAEAVTVINGRRVCSLLDVALVGTTDVKLSSLLTTSIAEVTVCAEFSSLVDIALVGELIDGTDTCSVSAVVRIEVMVVDLLVDAATINAVDVAVAKIVGSIKVCLLLDNILVDVTDDADRTPLPDATYEEGTVCAKEIECTSLLIVALLGVADDGVVCLLFSPTLVYATNAAEVCSAVMLTVVAEVRLPVNILLILEIDFAKSLLDDVLLSVTDDKVVVSSLLDKAMTDNVEPTDASLLNVMVGTEAFVLLMLTLSEETKIDVSLDSTLANVIGIVEFALVFNVTLVDVIDGEEVEITDIGIFSLLTRPLIAVMDVEEAEIE